MRTASGQGPSVATLPSARAPARREVRIMAPTGPPGTSARHRSPRKSRSSAKTATSTTRNADTRASKSATNAPPERVSAPTKSGNHTRRGLFFTARLTPASRHRPVHTRRTTARTIASPQNSTSGLLRSETMRSRPVGGSKAFCGRRSMFLTGAWGKEILLSAVRTKRAAVTARQKSPGRRSRRRLIAAAPGGRAAGGRGRSEALPQPVYDEVEPELELGVAVHLAEPVPEPRDVGELFGRQRRCAGPAAARLHGEAPDLGHRVPHGVTRERPERVQRRGLVEAGPPHGLQELLDEPDPVHRLRRPDDEQGKDVRVPAREPPKPPVRLPYAPLPSPLLGGNLELPQQHLDHPVQQGVLVGHVVVERHRLDPELRPQPPHAERLQPLAVGEPHRRLQHPPPAQRQPLRLHQRTTSRAFGDSLQDSCLAYVVNSRHRYGLMGRGSAGDHGAEDSARRAATDGRYAAAVRETPGAGGRSGVLVVGASYS